MQTTDLFVPFATAMFNRSMLVRLLSSCNFKKGVRYAFSRKSQDLTLPTLANIPNSSDRSPYFCRPSQYGVWPGHSTLVLRDVYAAFDTSTTTSPQCLKTSFGINNIVQKKWSWSYTWRIFTISCRSFGSDGLHCSAFGPLRTAYYPLRYNKDTYLFLSISAFACNLNY